MKKSIQTILRAYPFRLPAAVFLACLWANPGQSQSLTSPGQSQQFNRIGYVMTVGECYTPQAAAQLGGAANLKVDMNNCVAWANEAMQNSGTGIYVVNTGYFETAEADPGSLSSLLGDFYNWSDVENFYSTNGCGVLQCLGIGTDDAGLSYECWYPGSMSAVYLSANCFTHELGRNTCCEQGDGFGGDGLVTIMLFNYCGGNNLAYFSNPGVYYNGIQLLGSTSDDCGEGPLANEGNNARQFALNGAGYQGAKPVALSIYNPLLTAVHCGGAAVSTLSADQRTFAADQSYSGGTAWDANGYTYAVNVSGVTNPAPQVVYLDQRYGDMSYTFTNYLAGTNYLVRLHFSECCWDASGKRVFNVFINGQKVLTNFDVFAAAGAQNTAVIREIMTTANAGGKIVVGFTNVVDNAMINGIEILQGGMYVPVNLTATPGNAQVTLNWSVALGNATSYIVKRSTVSGGPYTVIGSTTSTTYNDNPLSGSTTYYYVVSAANGGNQSLNSLEVSATTPVTVNSDTWVGGSGNDFSTLANWIYAIGSGPVTNTDALVFGSVGSTTPYNDETGFAYSTITYNPGAQSFTIGGNAFTLGTNTTSGESLIAVNSANPQTINNNITLVNSAPIISTAGGNLTLGGNVSAAGALTKTGAGALTLAGTANTLSGGLTVGAGSVNVTVKMTSTNTTTVGSTAANAVLSSSGTLSQLNFNVGTVSGAVGAIYQTGGAVTATQAAAGSDFQIGNAAGAFGYYYAGAGTLAVNEIGLGGEASAGNAILDINGATVTDTGWLVVSRAGSAQTSILDVFSGALKYGTASGSGLACNWGAGQTSILNVMGGTVANTINVGINLNFSGTAGNSGILNLNGGSVEANSVTGTPGGRVNFNGGTLTASEANTAFMTGLSSACIYGGGATINNNSYSITVGQPLLAPAGDGVNGIASFTGGAGYIAPPIITVVPGTGDTTGAGAAAIAQINPQTGVVTNIIITCPGVNYTETPAFAVSGGGATAAATITGAAPTANTSGGVTSTGAGTLTLTASETYGGNTTISGGTLKLSSGPVLYMSFNDVSGSTVINQGSGGATMNGTLTGTAKIVSGGINGGNALSIPSGAANAAYVLVNNPVVAMTGAASWTIGMWVKTTNAGGVYAYQGSGSWASGNMTFYLNEGSDNGYGTKAGGVSYAQGWEEGSTKINDGNWHFVVMTCNGSTKAMYVDGNVDAIASSWAPATGVGSQLWIGGSADTGDEDIGLGGLIDGVYVYNYALTQAQVQSLYANTPVTPPVLPATTAVTVASGATLDVGGISQTIGSLTGPGGSHVILADTTTATGTLTVGNASSTAFAGAITGTGSLAKVGTGTLTLGGVDTYPGNTVVGNGTLALSGSGSIASSTNITVASGATFNISGLSSAFTLGTGQTLGGYGSVIGATTINGKISPGTNLGTLTFSTPPTLGASSVIVAYINRAGTPAADQIAVASGTLTYGGALTVTNIGGPPANGDTFQLFSAANYSGNFASLVLPPLTAGLVWNTNTLETSGTLSVTVRTSPTFNSVTVVGGNLIAGGSGGTANWNYYVLTSTNLAAGQWTIVATNQLDNTGSFVFTNAINPDWPQMFYQLQLQ